MLLLGSVFLVFPWSLVPRKRPFLPNCGWLHILSSIDSAPFKSTVKYNINLCFSHFHDGAFCPSPSLFSFAFASDGGPFYTLSSVLVFSLKHD